MTSTGCLRLAVNPGCPTYSLLNILWFCCSEQLPHMKNHWESKSRSSQRKRVTISLPALLKKGVRGGSSTACVLGRWKGKGSHMACFCFVSFRRRISAFLTRCWFCKAPTIPEEPSQVWVKIKDFYWGRTSSTLSSEEKVNLSCIWYPEGSKHCTADPRTKPCWGFLCK